MSTPNSAGKDAPLVERVGDQHFPWHYTEYGVVCACGRPCDSDEACSVVRRARRWTCEAHGVTTTGDCPSCDDEMVALTPSPTCQTCKRDLLDGEEAWAKDWTVIGPEGVRTETRYTCDTCVLSPGGPS